MVAGETLAGGAPSCPAKHFVAPSTTKAALAMSTTFIFLFIPAIPHLSLFLVFLCLWYAGLLVDAAGQKSAIDRQSQAGYKGCGVGGEKDCGSNELLGFAE